jgi:hypothetical protein
MFDIWFVESHEENGRRVWLELDLPGWRVWVWGGLGELAGRLCAIEPAVFRPVEVWWIR